MASLLTITKQNRVQNQQNKKKMKILIYTVLFVLLSNPILSQEKTLSIESTLNIVRNYHPVVKQAFLQNEISKNEFKAAKGVFDPKLQIQNQEKTFDNKLYYRYNTTELNIPLWYGIDVKVGTEQNFGDRMDPSLTKNNSAFVGVSMDPFRGLIVDKRSSIVKQAKGFVELTKNEQLLVVNDLLFDVSNAYWNWVNAYHVNSILTKSVKNNIERYDVVKKSFISGDRAAIDTTEALTQLQSIEIMQSQAKLDLQKARFELSNYFWTENGKPFEIDETIEPANDFDLASIHKIELGKMEEMINQATLNHPKIKMVNSKSNILDIEKRLKTIELFPSLKLNYNTLDNNLNTISSNISTTNNSKYGLSLTLPLFQRQSRAELAKTKNKIEDINWDKKYYSLEIENKVKSSFTEFYTVKQQIKTNDAILNAQKLLFDTENTKFQLGESSLFLINSREIKYIETEQKQIALKTKLFQSMYKNRWAMGSLN